MLGLWAHPDDETYLSAGLMALVRAAGNHVVCVHADRRRAGYRRPGHLVVGAARGRRTQEVRTALRIVGVSHRWSLGLPDGGCADVDEPQAVTRLAACIDRVRPDTIVTFGPDGITGHPDHVAVARVGGAGLAPYATNGTAAAGGEQRGEGPGVRGRLRRGRHRRARRRRHAPDADIALEVRLDERLADRKLRALLAHESQMDPVVDRIGLAALREWWRVEPFAEVVP